MLKKKEVSVANKTFNSALSSNAKSNICSCCHVNIGDGVQHCLASMDPDLEAFSRNLTDGSFATLAFQLTTFTKYLNEVFLSY